MSFAKFFQSTIGELGAIVHDDGEWNSVSTNDVYPDEVADYFRGGSIEWFSLDPL